MERASLADFLQAKSALIRLIENIRSATIGKDFAEIVWNGMKLCEPGVIFQAGGPEADYFTAEGLRKAADNRIRTMAPAGIWF